MAKNDYRDVHTMVGADAVIQGNVTCQGGVAVYGRVFGDVISEGPVRIAKGGEVHGNVQANDAQIGGSVDGNINSKMIVNVFLFVYNHFLSNHSRDW